MRRIVWAAVAISVAMVAWPAHPQGQNGTTFSDDVRAARARGQQVRVIVQADDWSRRSLLARHTRSVRRELSNALALDLNPQELDAIIRSGALAHLSLDLPVAADMAVTNKVTGAERVWAGQPGLLGLGATPAFNGAGITVAVIDSGIADHPALTGRVLAHVNLVSNEPGVSGDPFGHGTHVAGIVAGSPSASAGVTPTFSGGSAPAASLVDVRVLGRTGMGYTSDVIAGIDWAIANRARYRIRVINLSLGHAVAEPAATDPLCNAVARAVDAGLVVVASAGNYGRTAEGAPVLGGITSPGNSPWAITVGAIDTAGTVDRSDDTVAPYSSRGPTRYDLAVKPDVVAPGSRIVSLESAGSYLSKTYPAWHIAGSAKNGYFRLTGTSMATAVVSGGVALMLDAESDLTPAQVRIALQTGAQFMRDGGLIASGAGSVDFYTSNRLARGGLLSTTLNTLTSLLGLSGGATYRDRGELIDRIYGGTGVRLLGLLDIRRLWNEANNAEWGVLNLLGLSNPVGSIAPNYLVWGNVAGWTGSYYVVWGNTIQSPEGQYVVWGNSNVNSEYVVWGNSLVVDDNGGR
jgi:serine protease AprX